MHCVTQPRGRIPRYVTTGHISRIIGPTEPGFQARIVSEVIKNEQYRIGAKHNNDIAIIKLKTPFEQTSFVKPACLPYPSFKADTGETLIVSGWGLTDQSKCIGRQNEYVSLTATIYWLRNATH